MNRLLLSAVACLALSACSGDNSQEELQNLAQDGEWTITNFIDSGTDESSYFIDYRFTFEAGGTLKATNGSNTITGTWSITDDSSSDDSSSDSDTDFNIFINEAYPWDELNDDWDVQSFSSNEIVLIDQSSDGDIDELTFSK